MKKISSMQELKKQHPGLARQARLNSKKAPIGNGLSKRRRAILDFARDHGLVIHPGGGYEYYVKAFIETGHCPCDKTRLDCPCQESLEDIKANGWCKCRLFWRDLDTYKESHVKEA